MKPIRDRIVELRRVKAAELRPHPHNWRKHPAAQQAALAGVLEEIGYAGALIARQCCDGSLELIDGHLRAETTPDAELPVLIVDLDEREASLLLAVHDPLAAMAEADAAELHGLLATVDAERVDVAAILGSLLDAAPAEVADPMQSDLHLEDLFQVVVECRDEQQQRAVFERMKAEGFHCRVLTL